MLFLTINGDENEEDLFVMGKDFMRFRFETNDNLVHNKKVNSPVNKFSIK